MHAVSSSAEKKYETVSLYLFPVYPQNSTSAYPAVPREVFIFRKPLLFAFNNSTSTVTKLSTTLYLLPLFFSTQTGPALVAHLHAFSVVTIKSVELPVPDKSTNFPINVHVNCSPELDSYSFIAFMPALEIGFNSSSTLKSTAAANEAKHIMEDIIVIILKVSHDFSF